MKIYKEKITFKSTAQIEFIDITNEVAQVIENSGIREGGVCIFVQHTTMGVIINHNEPMLLQDFMRVLYHFAPVDERYSHDLFEMKKNNKTDGRSNGHSHCKAMLLGASVTVPIENGKMMLSELQSIFAVEFDGSRNRDAIIHVNG
ncbi:MAG: secondary thiamine-phosphate synthase enzyme YjbQ [Candidatus Moraniibacteriota bacterium]|jgi:secondary thiamine-phosphate synthase enzyme